MKKENIYIGWDIGGAHLKYSIYFPNSKIISKILLCELWKSIDCISDNLKIIHDKYDFPPPGSWKMYSNLKDFGDYIEASAKDISKAPYFASRFLAERFMAEGDEKNFAIRIELPEEEQVVNIDYDDDIPAGAQNYVFRGAMTNKRKSIWDKFMSMFVSPAEAQSNDNTDATDLTDLKNVRIMQLKGKQPFPMDGDDEYGRMNDAQRRIADTDLSDLDG